MAIIDQLPGHIEDYVATAHTLVDEGRSITDAYISVVVINLNGDGLAGTSRALTRLRYRNVAV